jgi:hypothetical protein
MMQRVERDGVTMECRQVRDLAEAFVSEQVFGETAHAIAAHLDRCPGCEAEVSGLRRLRASVRAVYLARSDRSPSPEFATALNARLRAEAEAMRPTGVSSLGRTWFTLAATLLLVVSSGLGLRGLGVSGFTAILQAAVGDHRYCLVTFKLTERPISLASAASLYNDPVDRSLEDVEPSPAQLSGGPIRVVERHSCVFHGRRFAHIVVRYKGALTSLVVTPDDRLLRGLPGASAPWDGSILTIPPRDGFNIAAFRGPRHVVVIISTLGDEDVREVARSMAASVSRAMKQG